MADGQSTTMTPPPDPGNAVPDVNRTGAERVGGFLGAISGGGALGSISDALERHHQKRLAEAKMYHDVMVEKLSHPAYADETHPEHQRVVDAYNAAKQAYLKSAGVNKETKQQIQQRTAIAEHHVGQQAQQGGGGQGGLTPPPAPESGTDFSGPTGGAPAAQGITPPPAPDLTDIMAGVPAERQQLADARTKKISQEAERFKTDEEIRKERAKLPTSLDTAWLASFADEHGRPPSTKEIEEHQQDRQKAGPFKAYTVPGNKSPVYAQQVGDKLVMQNGVDLPEGATPYKADPTEKPVSGVLNGKPTFGLYGGPDKGWLSAQTGEPIPGFSPPPNWGQSMLGAKVIRKMGPDGVDHWFQMNTTTGEYSIDAGYAPTGAAAHQIFQAAAIEQLAPQVIQDINANREILGNLSSYYKEWLAGTPVSDPRAAELMTELMSLAAMQPALHAFRGSNALETFEKMIGGLEKNPDSTIATINGLLKTPQAFTSMVKPKPKPGAKNIPPPPAPPAGKSSIDDEIMNAIPH